MNRQESRRLSAIIVVAGVFLLLIAIAAHNQQLTPHLLTPVVLIVIPISYMLWCLRNKGQ